MAPSHSHQLLVWTLPTIAVLLSYLLYKKKRIGHRSDTGDTDNPQESEKSPLNKSLEEELREADKPNSVQQSSPNRKFSRSLSGVDSAPIDIIIPPELRAVKSHPVVISDEDLDQEIEKIKSMKNGGYSKPKVDPLSPSQISKSKTSSPVKKNITVSDTFSKRKESSFIESPKMAQKDIAVVEEKFTSMKINNNNNKETPKKKEHKNVNKRERHDENEALHMQSNERDSANHSPLDVLLASPSLSSISDNHSEGSNDSGKGASDVVTPPHCHTPRIDVSGMTIYDFIIPKSLVGKLIGKNGMFVKQIVSKTNAQVSVRSHPSKKKYDICSVGGTQSEIDKALKMIRDKFPARKFPEVTLERVFFNVIQLIPDNLYLKLIEGINNDTILSCLVTPNHLFLQQPTHPSYPKLNMLSNHMNLCYSETNPPLLPESIPENTICAAYSVDGWYRANILSTDVETNMSYVKFLDYGGFAYVQNTNLRQIREDFILLPFQATECILANVRSVYTDGTWPEEAYNLVAEVTKGAIIYTQVADYTPEGIPLVFCYVLVGRQSIVFLNQQLVDSGFAEWVPTEEPVQQESIEGAVGEVQA